MTLETVEDLHRAFKSPALLDMARRICDCAFKVDGQYFWTDEVDMGGIDRKDANCSGTAFRILIREGVIRPIYSESRKSIRPDSNGRRVFLYALIDPHSARCIVNCK